MTKSTYIAGLLLLSLGAWQTVRATGPELSVAPVVRQQSEVITHSSAEFNIEVQGLTPPVSRSIEITGPAQDIHFRLADGLDFSSIDGLAHSLIKPGMTDEEKVKALFYFTATNFYDRGGSGCEDPLEYANLWGFSWCGNFALFLNAAWRALGFQTVFLNPVIGMPGGHTITCVFYDNQWHMYDSRLRAYFLNRDNRTVASLVDLDRDDFLVQRAFDYGDRMVNHWSFPLVMENYSNAASDWYDGFNAHYDNQTLFHKDTPPWDPRLDLRKGETLTLGWEDRGKWWNRLDLSPEWRRIHRSEGGDAAKTPPIIYANGTLVTELDPLLLKSQAVESSGLKATGGSRPAFSPSAAGQWGYAIYKVRVPYFIPSMSVEALAGRASADDSLELALSTDEGKSWLPLWSAEGLGQLPLAITTDQTQRVTMYSVNKYSYLLRFRLKAGAVPENVSLSGVRLTTDLYYRPMILPALKNGVNHLLYSDRTPGDSPRRIVYRWLENTNILFSEEQPCIGDRITITALVANQGNSPASQVKVRFYDGDPALGGVRIGEDQVIAEIAPGQTSRTQVEWLAVQQQVGASTSFSLADLQNHAGYTHNTIFVQVDPDNQLSEANKSDNLTSRDLVVNNMANLILKDPSFIEFARRGDKVLISAFVRNHNLGGPRPRAREARNVVVRFYDKQPVAGRMKQNMIGEAVIPAIAPGEFGAARAEWDVSGLAGRQRIYAVVDPEDQIPESWQVKRGDYMLIKKDLDLSLISAME